MQEPLLSVCIRAYNQEKYISQALDSVFMQKTSFPFEVIIGEDCSTDSTYKILLQYKERYSNIQIIKTKNNVGGTKNLRRIIEASAAKYIALCDGDDYWTDTYKLQKQVDFLESHPEYVGCFHNVINRFENKYSKPSYFLPIDFPVHHTFKSIIEKKWFMPINGEVFVRKFAFFPDWYDLVMNDDYVLNLALAKSGSFFYMPDPMAVYRRHQNNESNSYNDLLLINNNLREILKKMKLLYPVECAEVFDNKISEFETIINFLHLEKKYPWRKFFRVKTYRNWIGKSLKIQRRSI